MMLQAVAVVTDLVFSAKIVGTAEQLGVCARAVARPAALEETLSQGGVRLVMVDIGRLSARCASIVTCVPACRQALASEAGVIHLWGRSVVASARLFSLPCRRS